MTTSLAPPIGRRRMLARIAASVAGLAITGCLKVVPPGGATPAALARPAVSLVAQPDRNEWPEAFHQASAVSQEAYRYAVDHRDLLIHIPCYCGCASLGHTSNVDCYVKAVNGASVTLDPHGFGCETCAAITLDAKALEAQGMSHRAIRDAIDAKWRATGPGTSTSYPPA